MLDVARTSIYQAIREGRLSSERALGRVVIRVTEIERYRARTQPTGDKPKGRPRKKQDAAKTSQNGK